jgi:hypothetical protein
MTNPDVPTRTALVAFYRHIMAYIAAPKQVQQLRLIFLREELQPSGVLTGQVDAPRRLHEHLTAFLCRAVGAETIDTAINHLAFSIGGLSLVLFVQRTAVDEIAPELLADDDAVEATIQRLADHGAAMVDGERARRSSAKSKIGTHGAPRDGVDDVEAAPQLDTTVRGARLHRAAERS